jgi:hypothetical protein
MKATLGILLILLTGALPAGAALGEYEGSVTLDQRVLRGQVREEGHAGYTLHQIITPEGAVIREYVSPEGRVFAVSWHARYLPNLALLVGAYFPRVHAAVQARTQHGGPLIIGTPDFVFVSGGRMMNFHGSAYVPALLPRNLAPEVVR